jgi:hypothetical protein
MSLDSTDAYLRKFEADMNKLRRECAELTASTRESIASRKEFYADALTACQETLRRLKHIHSWMDYW